MLIFCTLFAEFLFWSFDVNIKLAIHLFQLSIYNAKFCKIIPFYNIKMEIKWKKTFTQYFTSGKALGLNVTEMWDVPLACAEPIDNRFWTQLLIFCTLFAEFFFWSFDVNIKLDSIVHFLHIVCLKQSTCFNCQFIMLNFVK